MSHPTSRATSGKGRGRRRIRSSTASGGFEGAKNYAVVLSEGDRAVIVTKAAISGVQEVTSEEAAEAVATAIEDMPFTEKRTGQYRRPVNTSRGEDSWALPKKEPQYRRKGLARNTEPPELVERAERLGVKVSPSQHPSEGLNWSGELSHPREMSPADIDNSYEWMERSDSPPVPRAKEKGEERRRKA